MTQWMDDEQKRNADNCRLFESMIYDAFVDVSHVGCGHHIMFWRLGSNLPEEIASADTLIFNHEIAKKVWGDDWQLVMTTLALEPPETRDALLHKLYYAR